MKFLLVGVLAGANLACPSEAQLLLRQGRALFDSATASFIDMNQDGSMSMDSAAILADGAVSTKSGKSGKSGKSAKGELDDVVLKLFFGAQDIALWVAELNGYFAENNLNVTFTYTPTSSELRDELVDGTIDMAYAAVDNSVLTYETQGETTIIMGGDSSLNKFIVQPDIESFADMQGRDLIVDWPGSAFALQAYAILKNRANLQPNTDYNVVKVGSTQLRYEQMVGPPPRPDASLLNPPFSIEAVEQNLTSLGEAVYSIGPYQSSGLFVMKTWLENADNYDKAVRFISAWVKGLQWAMCAGNKDRVLQILQYELDIDEDLAIKTYEELMHPVTGLTRDAMFLKDGFDNVLRIREEFEGGGPLLLRTIMTCVHTMRR